MGGITLDLGSRAAADACREAGPPAAQQAVSRREDSAHDKFNSFLKNLVRSNRHRSRRKCMASRGGLYSDESRFGRLRAGHHHYPSLKNPWGISRSAMSPWWVSNQGTNTSTLYSVMGSSVTKNALTVSIPTTATGPQGPHRPGPQQRLVLPGK